MDIATVQGIYAAHGPFESDLPYEIYDNTA